MVIQIYSPYSLLLSLLWFVNHSYRFGRGSFLDAQRIISSETVDWPFMRYLPAVFFFITFAIPRPLFPTSPLLSY